MGATTIIIPQKGPWWRKLLAYLGPGFIVCVAYIDPGNFQTNLLAGAKFQYALLWVILLASLAGLLIQSLAGSLGLVTGQHLSQHCRAEYARPLTYLLWFLAEIAMVCSDIPEVIGSAIALNLLFKIPLWIGVVITAFDALLILGLASVNPRWLESIVGVVVLAISICFMVELGLAKPDVGAMFKGMFVPSIPNAEAALLVVGLIGAMVMPHNLYLHSALVMARPAARQESAIRSATRFVIIEAAIALGFSFVINLSIVSLAAAVCSNPVNDSAVETCQDPGLQDMYLLLNHTLQGASQVLFAIALLCSGQISSVTGTYAAQYVMSGFLNLQMKTWKRNLLTRSVALVPSLIVSILAGASGAGKLILICSTILAFQLPFALVPLIKFVSSEKKMGPLRKGIVVKTLSWLAAGGIIFANGYLAVTALIAFVTSGNSPSWVIGLVCTAVTLFGLAYYGMIGYLAFRRDKEDTFPPLEETVEPEMRASLPPTPMHRMAAMGSGSGRVNALDEPTAQTSSESGPTQLSFAPMDENLNMHPERLGYQLCEKEKLSTMEKGSH